MSEQHQHLDWKERLHFLSSAFGVITGVAGVVTLLLLLTKNYTLLLFSSFVFIVFLFLWMLDFALRSSNSPIASLGDLTSNIPKALKEKPLTLEQDLMPHKVMQPSLMPRTTEQELIQALEQIYELKKLQPNIVRSYGAIVPAYIGEHDVIIEAGLGRKSDKDRDGEEQNLHALIVRYHNDPYTRPERRIATVNNVSAKITYKFFDGKHPQKKYRIAWLSEKGNRVDFGKNEERKLIVAILEGIDEPHIYIVQREFDGAHPEGFTRRTELVGSLFGVHACLISESDGTTIDACDFILEVIREPLFTVKLATLRVWKWAQLAKFQIEGYGLMKKIREAEQSKQLEEADNSEEEQANDWEQRVVDFLMQHLSESYKTRFLSNAQIARTGSTKRRFALPSFQPMTLYERIDTRVERLDQFSKEIA